MYLAGPQTKCRQIKLKELYTQLKEQFLPNLIMITISATKQLASNREEATCETKRKSEFWKAKKRWTEAYSLKSDGNDDGDDGGNDDDDNDDEDGVCGDDEFL